jgi:UDP-4-amino-4,6-dideoxy-N-acetyl-beta-L-altrosamine transaminase
VPDAYLPYGRQSIDEDDEAAVLKALRSEFLTTGPEVEGFEDDLRTYVGTQHAAALNSCTSALHAVYAAFGVGPGDEVITSPITFAATANAALYLGARPVFADIDSATGLIDPGSVKDLVSARTRAVVPVDYAGQPAPYRAIRDSVSRSGVPVIADAAHSLGATDDGVPVGQLADATALSFHPVKLITTGEGGAVVTNDAAVHERVVTFRSHGMVRDPDRLHRDEGPWYMEMQVLGFNYRLTDVQAALGRSQLRKLPRFLSRRREIAARYDRDLAAIAGITLPVTRPGVESAWHLYVLQLADGRLRRRFFEGMRSRGIGVQVHYLPVYLHPYYADLGYRQVLCPNAEAFYRRMVTLPIHPSMADADIDRVCEAVRSVAHETFG